MPNLTFEEELNSHSKMLENFMRRTGHAQSLGDLKEALLAVEPDLRKIESFVARNTNLESSEMRELRGQTRWYRDHLDAQRKRFGMNPAQ